LTLTRDNENWLLWSEASPQAFQYCSCLASDLTRLGTFGSQHTTPHSVLVHSGRSKLLLTISELIDELDRPSPFLPSTDCHLLVVVVVVFLLPFPLHPSTDPSALSFASDPQSQSARPFARPSLSASPVQSYLSPAEIICRYRSWSNRQLDSTPTSPPPSIRHSSSCINRFCFAHRRRLAPIRQKCGVSSFLFQSTWVPSFSSGSIPHPRST
jgi:hypothetical protein